MQTKLSSRQFRKTEHPTPVWRRLFTLVPTLRVGTPPRRSAASQTADTREPDAERRDARSHAERGNETFGCWLLPAILFVLCVLPHSFAYLRYHPDERHYTDAALEMLRSGDYLTPKTQTGELRFKKPILTYWLIAGSYHLFGVSPLSSRLPFVLLGAAIIGLTYRLGLKVLPNREGAWLAALIVAVHPTLVIASSQSIPDVVLSISLLMSLLGFCELLREHSRFPIQARSASECVVSRSTGNALAGASGLYREGNALAGASGLYRDGVAPPFLRLVIAAIDVFARRFCGRVAPQLDAESRSDSATLRLGRADYWLAYGGLGLGILAKGIPAAAFGVIAVGTCLWFGDWSDRQRRWRHLWGLTLTGIGTAVWFLLVYWQHGDAVLDEFFRDQVLDRGSRVWWQPLIHIPQVLGMAAVSFLPWTAWFLFSFPRSAWERVFRRSASASDSSRDREGADVANNYRTLPNGHGSEAAERRGAVPTRSVGTRGLLLLSIWSGAYLLLASGVEFVNLRYQVVIIPVLAVLLASWLMALPPELLELGLRRQARLMTGALVVALCVCVAFVTALIGLASDLSLFVMAALAWSIWAWRVIPRCRTQSAGLCGAISMMLFLPCGYFAMRAACPPLIEEQVYRKLLAENLEHQTLCVIGEPVTASRLRVASAGKLSVKFLPGNDLQPFAAGSVTDASMILIAARTWPVDVARHYELIQIRPILDVTFPQLFRATCCGDLPEYLGKSQRSFYLGVRRPL